MGAFQRSPSKVWWGDDYYLSRNFSGSLGSQDSGFSDNDSPPLQHLLGETPSKYSPKNLLKNISEDESIKAQNLSINYKQKSSPRKSLNLQLENKNASFEIARTPNRHVIVLSKSDPVKRHRFQRNSSLKVSRSLFKRSNDYKPSYQYARDINDDVESQFSYGNSKVIHDDSYKSNSKDSTVEVFDANNTRPLRNNNSSSPVLPLDTSGSVNIQLNNEDNDSFNSSECESELENAFRGALEHDHHTSTPKASGTLALMRHKRYKRRSRISAERTNHERSLQMNFDEEAEPVQKWLEEARELYEPECMTLLQSKSIAAELSQKVTHFATRMTNTLRKILADAEVITTEFANIKGQKQHVLPLAQSIARLVEEFLQNYAGTMEVHISKICNEMKYAQSDEVNNWLEKLDGSWEKLYKGILTKEIKVLISELEGPHSELHVRAALTGVTSIALRHNDVIGIFIQVNAIQCLCVLGEKCESSTVRSLVLRALSTVSCDNAAIRQLESASGIQLIADTICEETRPEPERSEAVALLAQITAPWIENNNCVKGLHEHVRSLVISLTNFIISTKCCQNLLLCTAALANLTEMESNSIKYVIHQNSVGAILRVLKSKGALISVYLLEQIAILIANLSIRPEARELLTEEKVAVSLLQFLQCSNIDEEVQQRVQQKSVIALSRLSCNIEAAKQIVQFDGISKLVLLCRERKARHNSDAVLVAALATLRKITEACGNSVIDPQDLQELVKPRLLDSFLTYSTQNESYV